MAAYWHAFAANGKAHLTVREAMKHAAGLSGLRGASQAHVFDHIEMEERLAAAPPGRLFGQPAYHALTFGWLMSGLARAVTGKDMRVLFREELAEPLNTDGFHLGRPPAESPTRVAEVIMPQRIASIPLVTGVALRVAHQFSGAYRSMYFPGLIAAIQGDNALLDAQLPAANGVVTARALARMCGAIANRGEVDGARFLSRRLVAGLAGERKLHRDRNIFIPLGYHLGYRAFPIGNIMPGFGHIGLGSSFGWSHPEMGLAMSVVVNRLVTPLTLTDFGGFLGLYALIRQAAARARECGYRSVHGLGAPYS